MEVFKFEHTVEGMNFNHYLKEQFGKTNYNKHDPMRYTNDPDIEKRIVWYHRDIFYTNIKYIFWSHVGAAQRYTLTATDERLSEIFGMSVFYPCTTGYYLRKTEYFQLSCQRTKKLKLRYGLFKFYSYARFYGYNALCVLEDDEADRYFEKMVQNVLQMQHDDVAAVRNLLHLTGVLVSLHIIQLARYVL